MTLLFRGAFAFQIPGRWFSKAWLPSGDRIYLVEENEKNFMIIHELNSETLKWSRFALNKCGEHVCQFGERSQHFLTCLITNEFIIVCTVNWDQSNNTSRLYKININTGELKEWRFDHYLNYKDAVIVNQRLYAFKRFHLAKAFEFTTLDLTTDNLQWTPQTRVENTCDTVAADNVRLAHLSYEGDIYWLYGQLFNEEISHTHPHPIEKFKLYKISTSTHRVTKIREELDSAFMLHYQLLCVPFVIGDELCFVFTEYKRDLSWMITYNVSSKEWKKRNIPHVGQASVCCVDSKLFTFKVALPYRVMEEEKEVGIIALSPSLQELCEVVIINHHVDTSELPPILQERLKRYANILDAQL